jgi:hypothetical protein
LAEPAAGREWLLVTEGNRLLRLDLARPDAAPEVRIENAARGGERGRDVNGMVCPLPGGGGRFLLGEDTGQPDPPPGWGVFSREGTQLGKLTATYRAPLGEPYGCAFDADGRLFTTSVGNRGFGEPLGQLILWLPPYEGDRDSGFCKLATDIGTAGGVAVDARGRVYVASAGRLRIERFSPPFPTAANAAGGCGATGPAGSPVADTPRREVFASGLYTFSGLAFRPDGHLYASSVFTGEILELSPEGERVRTVLDPDDWLPPHETGSPMGLALDRAGNLYYADLDLAWDFPSIGPGPDGKVWRIRFDARGEPLPPEVLLRGLAFPDGVAVVEAP